MSRTGKMPEQRKLSRRSAPVGVMHRSLQDEPSDEIELIKPTVAPFRLDRNSMTVLDRELGRILKRERDAAAAKSGGSDDAENAQQSMRADEEMERHWRRRLLRFLHHRSVHTAMTSLLILDLLAVVISLELQIQMSSKESAAKEACLTAYETGTAVPAHFLNSSACNPSGLGACDYTQQASYQAVHGIHIAELALAYISICILTLFLVENIMMMAAIGWFFFRHFFFILDVFVVTVSLALELVAVASAHMGLVVGNILIIARMWRFFRVAHGIYFLDHRSDHRSEAVHVTMSKNGGEASKQTEDTYDATDLCRDGANMGVGVDGKIRAGSCPPIED